MEFQVKGASDITQTMVDTATANSTKINDFSPGSKIRTVFEAAANVLASLYYATYQALKDAIEDAVYDAFNFPLDPGAQATTTLTLSRSTPAPQNYAIPAGTIVTTTDGVVEFTTNATVTLLTGTTSITAVATAIAVGTNANVKSGKLVALKTRPVGVETVTNASDVVNGVDAETRDARKKRFRDYVSTLSRGTTDALEYAAKRVAGVVEAEAVENPTLTVYTTSGAGTIFADITTLANLPYGTPVDMTPLAIGEALYIGSLEKFRMLWLQLQTPRVGGAGTWEYWNGTAWAALTVTTDGSSGFTQSGMLVFTSPADWLAVKVNGSFQFWVRWRVTGTVTTAPGLNHMFATPPPGYVDLYIQDVNGAASAQMKSNVATNVVGYRGHGVSVNVLAPTLRTVAVTATLTLDPSYDRDATLANVESGVGAYLGGFKLAEDLYTSRLVNEIIRLGKGGVLNAALAAPTTDIYASAGEIVRAGTITITAVN